CRELRDRSRGGERLQAFVTAPAPFASLEDVGLARGGVDEHEVARDVYEVGRRCRARRGVVHAAACWYPPGHAMGLGEEETERDLSVLHPYRREKRYPAINENGELDDP